MKQTGLLILLFLLCAVGGMAQKGNIVITGQVVNRQADTPRSLNINVDDSFSTDSRMNVPLDEDGRFRANLDFPFGHDFSIDYDGIFMLYASPGDSLHITIDAGRLNKDVDAITFSGRVDERCVACNRFSKEMSDVIYWRPDSLQHYDLPLDEYIASATRSPDMPKLRASVNKPVNFCAPMCFLPCPMTAWAIKAAIRKSRWLFSVNPFFG